MKEGFEMKKTISYLQLNDGTIEEIVDMEYAGDVVYMAVTADELELPMFATTSRKELFEWSGLTKAGFETALYKKSERSKGNTRGFRIIRVNLDDAE